tara:strand:- start:555 stop:1559 length:1005 start_codon:yes stop_codon:yes gene_type:complete
MATTQIADVVVPDIFSAYTQELSTELSLLVRAGIVVRNPQLDGFLAGGGQLIQMPKWEDLLDTEANVSGDSGTAVAEKAATHKEIGIRHNRNQAWSSMDLSAALAGSDPMSMIAQRVASYWVRQEQLMLNNIVAGIIAGTSTIINDIAAANNVDAIAANLATSSDFLDTFQLLGDHKGEVTAVAVHSVVHTNMQKANLIDFVPDSRADVGFGTYMGKSLLVDDGLTVDITRDDSGGVDQPMYTSIVFGTGAFQSGVGSPRVGTEIERTALAGTGGGEEVLVNRREFALHPAGFSVATNVGAGESPTNAELAANTAYTLVGQRKDVRLAVLRSNG